MEREEVTEKLFPPPGSNTDIQMPPPTIRDEFLAHRLHFDKELKAWRLELGAALTRMSPPITPASVAAKARAGALAGLRYGGVALAAGEFVAALAKATGHPEIEGPVRVLITMFGGTQ